MNIDAFDNAVMSALTRHALKQLGKQDIIPDETLIAKMRAEYTYRFANGNFELVRRENV